MKVALFFTIMSFFYTTGFAKLIDIDDTITHKGIGSSIEYLVDKNGSLDITDIALKPSNADQWKQSKTDALSLGFTKDIYWIRFTLRNTSNQNITCYLMQKYPLITKIDLYDPMENNNFQVTKTGIHCKFSQRPLRYWTFVFPLHIKAGKIKTVYLRYENECSMNIVLSLYSPQEYEKIKEIEALFMWLFYGILLIMIMYNLFIFISIREISYFYHISFIIFVLLMIMVLDGMAFQYLWPNDPWMSKYSMPIIIAFEVIFNFLFMRNFIQINKYFKTIDKTIFFVIAVGLIIAATTPLINNYRLSISGAAIYAGLSVSYSIVILFYLIVIKKSRQSLFILLSYGVYFICALLPIFKSFGFITDSPLIKWALHFGSTSMVTLLSLGLADRINTMRKELRILNAGLEDKVKERTIELEKANDKLKELDRLKSNFFSNISHEIRTPLTLIISPIESALQGDLAQGIDETLLHSIYRNANNLLHLVNNLLDFSKIEAGKMQYKIREINIVKLFQIYVTLIESAAKSKNIMLRFYSVRDNIMLFLDVDKMEKVIMNLLSNALKFTKEGSITISITDNDDNCFISIADSGEGIPEDKIPIIFDRFSQADSSTKQRYEGTGIGLALVKELLEAIDGIITVESKCKEKFPDSHGTTFTITLRKNKKHFEGKQNVEFITDSWLNEEISDFRKYAPLLIDFEEQESNAIQEYNKENINNSSIENFDEKRKILIVDDNPDMRNLITYLLKDKYYVYCAIDGEDGLSKVKTIMPDIVITDVMMPKMNGYVMTQRIKDNKNLKNIPVLMITAKADISNKIEGLEHGADDYLAKPFNSKELIARIASLIKTYDYQKLIALRNIEIEHDLEIARQIINKLLPEKMLTVPGYTFYTTYIPMDKIGGDFYDINKRDNHIEIFIADVSGHGLPGAFLALITKITFDRIVGKSSPSRVLQLINEVIVKSTVKDNFVTAFYSVIDQNVNIIQYCSAGHFPLMVYRSKNNEFIELKTKGNPLGWFKELKLEEKYLQLYSGDRLVLYTDGIIESKNADNELFGEERFKDFIKSHCNIPPKDFSDMLIKYLKNFSGSQKFDDDVTLIVVDIE